MTRIGPRGARRLVVGCMTVCALFVVPVVGIVGTATPAGAVGSPVMGGSRMNAGQLAAWFRAATRSPYRATVSVETLAGYYITEGAVAGVRGDVAFAQSVLETGWFNFPDGGYIRPGDNNFAGIGAYGDGSNVKRWATAQLGVRGQVQLLRRYADPSSNQYNIGYPPVPELWNPAWRYDIPGGTHGWAPTWNDMSGRWASSLAYADSIFRIYNGALSFNGLPREVLATGTTPVWTSWEPMGGQAVGGPDVSSWAPGRLDLFVRGTDNGLWHRYWNGDGWSAWEPLGGVLTSDPTAVSWGPDRIDVFVRGTDSQLWQRYWNGHGWSGWRPLGGTLAGSPDVASRGSNWLDVFVRGTDNGLWHRYWNGNGWSAWEPLGGVLTSDPSAVGSVGGYLDVFARSPGGPPERMTWNGVNWSSWTTLDGMLNPGSGGDATSWPGGRVDLSVAGTDGRLWGTDWQGVVQSPWEPHGGVLTSDPGAVSWGPGRIDTFVRGTDGALWHIAFQ